MKQKKNLFEFMKQLILSFLQATGNPDNPYICLQTEVNE